jgi:hypothetical protein
LNFTVKIGFDRLVRKYSYFTQSAVFLTPV